MDVLHHTYIYIDAIPIIHNMYLYVYICICPLSYTVYVLRVIYHVYIVCNIHMDVVCNNLCYMDTYSMEHRSDYTLYTIYT